GPSFARKESRHRPPRRMSKQGKTKVAQSRTPGHYTKAYSFQQSCCGQPPPVALFLWTRSQIAGKPAVIAGQKSISGSFTALTPDESDNLTSTGLVPAF